MYRYRCNEPERAPWHDLLAEHDSGDTPKEVKSLICELSNDEHDWHADWLGGMGPGVDVWVMWDDYGHFRYMLVQPCETADENLDPVKQEPCTLPADHDTVHSWEFDDLLHG